MKVRLTAILFAALTASGEAQVLMDNDSVLRLVHAGMNDEIVVRIIESQPGNYANAAETLSALRRAGVSDMVIAAMLHHPLTQSQIGSLVSTYPVHPIVTNIAAMATYSPAPAYPPVSPTQASDQPVILRDGTPVRLRLNRTLSSEDAQVGQKVDFDVLEDLRSDDRIVIPRGTKAIGAITEAEPRKRMARGGKLNLVMEYMTLNDGTKIALRASKESAGGGHAGVMTAGIVAAAFVAWPAAPLFLMMRGKAAVIPEATEITAYTEGDIQIPTPDMRDVGRLR